MVANDIDNFRGIALFQRVCTERNHFVITDDIIEVFAQFCKTAPVFFRQPTIIRGKTQTVKPFF